MSGHFVCINIIFVMSVIVDKICSAATRFFFCEGINFPSKGKGKVIPLQARCGPEGG